MYFEDTDLIQPLNVHYCADGTQLYLKCSSEDQAGYRPKNVHDKIYKGASKSHETLIFAWHVIFGDMYQYHIADINSNISSSKKACLINVNHKLNEKRVTEGTTLLILESADRLRLAITKALARN